MNSTGKTVLKKILIIFTIILVAGAGIYIYYATLKYDDTADLKPDYKKEAIPFIREFEKDLAAANKLYAEKVIEVSGPITAAETADSTINIKMADSTTGSYLIFAFQRQHLDEARTLTPGEQATIRGSCSDGVYSEILGVHFISFKRCALIK